MKSKLHKLYLEKELIDKLPEFYSLGIKKIQDTDTFAKLAHHAQKRKYTNFPYIVHPRQVACIVAQLYPDDIILIQAALLHDVVEDTQYTLDDIENMFGKEVALLVKDVTNISKPIDGNRAIRKEIDKKHILLGTEKAKILKCIDIYCNASNILDYDSKFAKVWLKEKQSLLKDLTINDIFILDSTKLLINHYMEALDKNKKKPLLNR